MAVTKTYTVILHDVPYLVSITPLVDVPSDDVNDTNEPSDANNDALVDDIPGDPNDSSPDPDEPSEITENGSSTEPDPEPDEQNTDNEPETV